MHPQETFKENQVSKLGYAPVHPLLHQELSVRPLFHYIFITLCVMCYAWSVLLFTFFSSLVLLAVLNKLEPSFLCVGEKHAPLYPRTHHRIFMLIFAMCVLYLFVATVMLSSYVFMFIFFQEILSSLLLELSLFFMITLFRELAYCIELCVLT